MTFSIDLSRAIEKAKDHQALAYKKIAIELFGEVIRKSPVDTGRFLGNWQCGINVMPTTATETTDKDGGATTSAMTKSVMSARGLPTFWLANNLPYANKLEFGYSRQAPTGMVRVSLAEISARYGR